MTFTFTPEDAQPIALRISKYYKKRKYSVKLEKALETDAPYRTTIYTKYDHNNILIEAQYKLNYHSAIKDLAKWINNNRKNCELYIGVSLDTQISLAQLSSMRNDGVGVFSIDKNSNITIIQKARNPVLVISVNPSFNFGKFSSSVHKAVTKFNETDQKDGFRDLCEIFELAVEEIGIKLCRKNKFSTLNETAYKRKDLNDRINVLASSDAYASKPALIDETLKIDLHAFKNARNMFDHKTKNRKEERRRQLQCPDKMVLGTRLIHELEELRKNIR